MEHLKQIIRAIQPKAEIFECNYGDVDLDLIVNTHKFDWQTVATSAGWIQEIESERSGEEDHEEDDDEHEHHHHHHDGEECDDPECECHHHHHHHADDVFSSWGKETPKKFSKEALEDMLHKLDSGDYGHILRAKGIVNGEDGWLEFDYVPEEHEVRAGHPDYTGRLCVIGAELKEDGLAELFGV